MRQRRCHRLRRLLVQALNANFAVRVDNRAAAGCINKSDVFPDAIVGFQLEAPPIGPHGDADVLFAKQVGDFVCLNGMVESGDLEVEFVRDLDRVRHFVGAVAVVVEQHSAFEQLDDRLEAVLVSIGALITASFVYLPSYPLIAAAVFVEPRLSILVRCAAEIADYPDMYAAFKRDSVDRCLAVIEDALHEAITRGELRADIKPIIVAEAVIGAISLRANNTADFFPVTDHEELIGLLLDGLRPRDH